MNKLMLIASSVGITPVEDTSLFPEPSLLERVGSVILFLLPIFVVIGFVIFIIRKTRNPH